MTLNTDKFELTRFEVPLNAELVAELVALWEQTFEVSYQDFRRVLLGDESAENKNIIYVARSGSQLAGTCQLTVGRSNPELGGLGEVAVREEFRCHGLGTGLCAQARDEFQSQGGQAVFLGTVNPTAARVYRRLKWRRLANTNVMACITGEESPEEFLVDYFRGQHRSTSIAPLSAVSRIPMIPLAVMPHDWQVLDANARLFSTRNVVQNSCMSLFPRYEGVMRDGRGAAFGAWTEQGRLAGLSTAQIDQSEHAHIDGFACHGMTDTWSKLIEQAMNWSRDQGAANCYTVISIEDEDKRTLLESLGFESLGPDEDLDLGERTVASVRLQRTV